MARKTVERLEREIDLHTAEGVVLSLKDINKRIGVGDNDLRAKTTGQMLHFASRRGLQKVASERNDIARRRLELLTATKKSVGKK